MTSQMVLDTRNLQTCKKASDILFSWTASCCDADALFHVVCNAWRSMSDVFVTPMLSVCTCCTCASDALACICAAESPIIEHLNAPAAMKHNKMQNLLINKNCQIYAHRRTELILCDLYVGFFVQMNPAKIQR